MGDITKEAFEDLGRLQERLLEAKKLAERLANHHMVDLAKMGIDLDVIDKMEERAVIAYGTWEPAES